MKKKKFVAVHRDSNHGPSGPWRVANTVYVIPAAGKVRPGSVHRDGKPKYSTGSYMFHGRKVNLNFIFVFVSVEE